jgi:parvulin-like peptidyl-prolyl isomerase
LAKADEIFEEANKEGVDFAERAKEKSDGPSARKGGDLGIFTHDRMVSEFSDAAFALKEGEISKPVKTKFGFHIIKVFGKYPPGDLPKEALADQIKERLEARKLHQGKRDLKAELLEKYKVENKMEAHLGPDPRKRRRNKKGGKPKGPGPSKPAKAGAPDPAADATKKDEKAPAK